MAEEAVETDIEVRFFLNRFSWRWEKFTDDRAVVARILQHTRELLGYAPTSRFPEVQFANLDQSGEWYLNTQEFQMVHGIDSRAANERLKDAFIKACRSVGDEYDIAFTFQVIDMVRGGIVIENR